jgi:hypothetical protein
MSTDQYLVPVGNTIQLVSHTHLTPQTSSHVKAAVPIQAACAGIRAALVIGDTLTSHFWLNILGLSSDSSLRYYIVEEDLGAVCGLLHVIPDVVPSFLVFQSGFVIDWFPAPLPNPGCAVDPLVLLGMVRTKLSSYR